MGTKLGRAPTRPSVPETGIIRTTPQSVSVRLRSLSFALDQRPQIVRGLGVTLQNVGICCWMAGLKYGVNHARSHQKSASRPGATRREATARRRCVSGLSKRREAACGFAKIRSRRHVVADARGGQRHRCGGTNRHDGVECIEGLRIEGREQRRGPVPFQ